MKAIAMTPSGTAVRAISDLLGGVAGWDVGVVLCSVGVRVRGVLGGLHGWGDLQRLRGGARRHFQLSQRMGGGGALAPPPPF